MEVDFAILRGYISDSIEWRSKRIRIDERESQMKFKIVLERDEDGWYAGTCPSLPGCISQGKTEKQAIKHMKEAIQLHLKSLSEDGLPLKSKDKKKEVLVSIAV
jgi:predicted RNase H-like HicB family nuclease